MEKISDEVLNLLQELKVRREADEKPLEIKDQLRMVHDRCPDIWEKDIQYCPSFYGLKQFNFDDCMKGCKGCCKECWNEALKEHDIDK